ncbi:carbohydrate kinase family protein [bacterium]|nr:carbohydrate kinase family protein [bacterium]
MNYDIITFGSGTRDTFLRLKEGNYRILGEGESVGGQSLCFPLGSKIFIEDLQVSTGGGATNTACTFSNQGLRVAVCTKVGDDKGGEAVIEELKKFKVDTRFIKKDKQYLTAFSAILSFGRERTILIYRGACHFLEEKDIPFNKLKTKWFYLAPLSEKSAQIFGPLVKFAVKKGIKIAVNPGNSQINLGQKILKPILGQIDILILNKKEASLLSGIEKEQEMDIIRKLKGWIKGILVITKGKEGSVVCDGKYIYKAKTPSVLPLEKTGAGDAYGSGFLSGLLEKNDIKYAIQLATANATSCIQKIGAKNGLLKKGQWGKWPKVKVEKKSLG